MKSRRLVRMRIEVVLAIVFAVFAVATIMDPHWIEQLFAFDPDRGGGDAEWAVTLAFGVASLAAASLAGRDWRLLQAETSK